MGPIDRDFLNRCRLRKERKFQFLIETFILVIWRPLKITSGGPWPPLAPMPPRHCQGWRYGMSWGQLNPLKFLSYLPSVAYYK